MRKILAMALGLIGLVMPAAVRADDIVSVTLSNVTFTGATCGPSLTALCTETFSASFLWDNTTAALVPGTGQVSSAGALLAPFAFAGASRTSSLFGLPFITALWTSPDEFIAIVNGVPTVVSTGTTDSILVSIPFELNTNILPTGTCNISDSFCQPASLQMSCLAGSACSSDFPHSEPGSFFPETPTTGTLSVATVPEPSSLLLLGTGLLGLGLVFRRRIRLRRSV